MFNFDNIKKLFSYNWNNLIKNIVPKGNISGTIEEKAYKDINNGAIVRIISVAFSKIATIGLAVWIVVKAYKAVYGSEIINYAISSVLSEHSGEYIVDIISAAIIPIAILIYNLVMKNKKQSYWVYFIVLIYALIQTVYSIFGIFGWLGSLLVSPVFALIGIVSILLNFLGNVHIAVGCIDFCMNKPLENNTNQVNTQVGNYQPQSTNTNQVQNNVSNVSTHTINQVNVNNNTNIQKRFCTNCGQPITPGTSMCPSCNQIIN